MNSLPKPMHLIQFTVGNYRSIKEPVTFSMIASSKHKKNTLFNAKIAKKSLIRTAVLFGANASGKSNILLALLLMKRYVTGSYDLTGNENLLKPFALDDSNTDNSLFEVSFEYDGRMFIHGLEINSHTRVVAKEWLKFADPDHPRLTQIFERNFDEIKINTNLTVGEHGISRSFIKQVSSSTAFVTTLSRLAKRTIAHDAVKAWDSCFILNTLFYNPLETIKEVLYESKSLKRTLIPLLKEADMNIVDLDVQKSGDTYKLYVGHRSNTATSTSKKVWLDIADESDGTQKFLSFALHLATSRQLGSVMILDELGSTLHPTLMRFIIRFFENPQNTHHAQLILTAHDTNLLNNLLSRDQIYFTQKNSEQATELYSLSDFKNVRGDLKNLDERYLRGDYGGVPRIRDEV